MKIVYLVTKIGTYSQGIYGAFDYYVQAKEHAEHILKYIEPDDHHTFFVEPILFNFEYYYKCNFTFSPSIHSKYRIGKRSDFTDAPKKDYWEY